jgi:hypothetical protein
VAIPSDGSVRDSVVIDSSIGSSIGSKIGSSIGRSNVVGAVLRNTQLGLASLERGAVALDCQVAALRMGADTLALGSVGEYLRVPDHCVHTSIVADPEAEPPVIESWFADARDNPGDRENYEQPRYGNPTSFAAKFEQVRRRERDAPKRRNS